MIKLIIPGLMRHNARHFNKVLLGQEFGPLAAKNEEKYLEYMDAMGYSYRDLINQDTNI